MAKKKKKKKGCIGTLIGIIAFIVIVVVAAVFGPLASVIKFAESLKTALGSLIDFIDGQSPEEELYDWVLINGPELQLSLDNIEGLPFDVSAVEAALKCELERVDSNIYTFEVENEVNETYTLQYNLRALTSNYGVPWQLLLTMCIANQYSGSFSNGGEDYIATADDVTRAYNSLDCSITYITNYWEYNSLKEAPSFEEFAQNCVIDLEDTEGKFTCVYKTDSDGHGVYYPVVCLDTVSTWLYDYKFEYELVLDEEGRPVEYKVANVVKESDVAGLLKALEWFGITDISLFTAILGYMPYASDRGIVSELRSEYNHYKIAQEESVFTEDGYEDYLALKELYGDIYYAEDMHELRTEIFTSVNESGLENEKNAWSTGISESYMHYRSDVALYASKFLHAVYYMPPILDENGNRVSHVSGWYSQSEIFTIKYPNFGMSITEAEDVELITKLGDSYKVGMLYGMTDWDFVTMVLGDTLYLDVSKQYIDSVGSFYLNNNTTYYDSADFLIPKYDTNYYGNKDYEHQYFTTADAFYDFLISYNSSGEKYVAYIMEPTELWLSDDSAMEDLLVGDIGMRVENGDAVSVGIYVGKVNGYDAFIHLGGGTSDLGLDQPFVEVSYHESTGAVHPDGGTVDYNVFIRMMRGSYPLVRDGDRKFGGGFTRFNDN